MMSSPYAIEFNDGTSTNLHVYVTSTGGEVWCRFWNGTRWRWLNHGNFGVAITSKPFAVVSEQMLPSGNPRRLLYIFAIDNSGLLQVLHWTTADWVWDSLGDPGVRIDNVNGPSAVSVPVIGKLTRAWDDIHVFVRGTDDLLYSCVWSYAWNWQPHNQLVAGAPGVARRLGEPQFIGATSTRDIDATGALIIKHYQNDEIVASPLHVRGSAGMLTYWLAGGTQRSYAFFRAHNRPTMGPANSRHLAVWYWDNVSSGTGHWNDLYVAGQGPVPNTSVASTPTAVEYENRIYVFFIDTEGDLREILWTGSDWKWGENHGKPPSGRPLARSPSAIAYTFGSRNLYVYAVDDAGHLWERNWFPTVGHWRWGEHHLPGVE
jgi:hypothetical protein